jgi:hypothetical protein
MIHKKIKIGIILSLKLTNSIQNLVQKLLVKIGTCSINFAAQNIKPTVGKNNKITAQNCEFISPNPSHP